MLLHQWLAHVVRRDVVDVRAAIAGDEKGGIRFE